MLVVIAKVEAAPVADMDTELFEPVLNVIVPIEEEVAPTVTFPVLVAVGVTFA